MSFLKELSVVETEVLIQAIKRDGLGLALKFIADEYKTQEICEKLLK